MYVCIHIYIIFTWVEWRWKLEDTQVGVACCSGPNLANLYLFEQSEFTHVVTLTSVEHLSIKGLQDYQSMNEIY